MKLLNTKSMMRYLPPNGTAGLARSVVSGERRVPLPPASTRTSTRMCINCVSTLFQAELILARGDFVLLCVRIIADCDDFFVGQVATPRLRVRYRLRSVPECRMPHK